MRKDIVYEKDKKWIYFNWIAYCYFHIINYCSYSSTININVIEDQKKEHLKIVLMGAAELVYAEDLLDGNNNNKIIFTYENGVESSNIPGKNWVIKEQSLKMV